MPVQFSKDVVGKSTKPIIVNAFATWCPHCAKMKPLYEELEKEVDRALGEMSKNEL